MDVLMPRILEEALALKAQRPEAVPIAGGTDLMVELNVARRRPRAMIDLSHLAELREWRSEDRAFFVGAGVTYSRIIHDLSIFVPLRQASCTVGSLQIRNRGTVGGNLGTASPAGDALPVLAAYDAEVLLGSKTGTRTLPWNKFLLGPKRTAIRPDELIVGARWPLRHHVGSFSKVGTRNAMVIAAASLALVLDEDDRAVHAALGSVGPTILRAPEAEAFAAAAMADAGIWDELGAPLPLGVTQDFGALVARAARPIDDVRGTAAYRRHACKVLGARALGWLLQQRSVPAKAA